MSLIYILGSWTVLLLFGLYYLGLLGTGNRVVNESTIGQDSTKPVDDEAIAKVKKKYAKKKRKKKKRQEKKQSAVVKKEHAIRNQEEKPDSLPETNETKEKSQAPKAPVNQTKKPPAKEKKSIPRKTYEPKVTPSMTQERNATSLHSLPQPKYTTPTEVTPADVSPAAPHSTSYDFTQPLTSFRTTEAPSPLISDNQAPAPLANNAQAPALLTNNAQAPAPLVNNALASAPLVNDTHATASLDNNDMYAAANSTKVNELEDEEPQETDDEAPIEELGGDWFAYRSTEYGLPYYHNVRTLETVWDRPVVEPEVESDSEEPELDEPDSSQLDQKLNSPGQRHQINPTLQQNIPTLQQQSPLNQQQRPHMGQAPMYSSGRSPSRPLTFAEKLRLAKQRSPVAVPKLLIKTKQKKTPVAGLPPPLYSPPQMPTTTDTSSWAAVSATPAPKKLITTSSSWVKVGVPAEPEVTKKKGPATLAEQIQAFKTALMQARTAKKWKQQEMARKLDIRPQELSKYEQGKDVPSPALINKMTRLLGVKLPRVKKSKMKELQPLPDDKS